MTQQPSSRRLADGAPSLQRLLKYGAIVSPAQCGVADIRCETTMMPMRDGVRLATDIYLPPRLPAPVVAMRTPYGRSSDRQVGLFLSFARRGYVVVSQDCRGTGDSEPDSWDYYMHEPEDGYDFVEWVSQQDWFDSFLAACGGSYVGQTQWQMALHPQMSTVVPHVSGLGVGINTLRMHMFVNGYARSVGKGEDKTLNVPFFEAEALILDETLSTGWFNEPLNKPFSETLLQRYPELRTLTPAAGRRWLWERYCAAGCAERAQMVKEATGATQVTTVVMESLPDLFGHRISHDAHTLPHPQPEELVKSLQAPPLMVTGWYDWCLNDALDTWDLLRAHAEAPLREQCRLLITPHAHNVQGYHEGAETHAELREPAGPNFETLLYWYETIRQGRMADWPRVVYYLMGANEWQMAEDWPVPDAQPMSFYLGDDGLLSEASPTSASAPDSYNYDPQDPTPTVGGSIVSFVYPPGSVDVSAVQQRSDVLVYTTPPLEHDLDVVGPLRVILYASSSAVDTDFTARLSDVFPDGRAIQLQNGALRARYRDLDGEPALLEPGRVYRFEIDLWATANRFKAGHRLRIDIASADFPKFDRNANLGGTPGEPVPAEQTIYHDPERPSQLIVSVLPAAKP